MMAAPAQAHVFTPGCGHIHSTNCWCEPNRFYWLTAEDGSAIYVCEHNDDTTAPHEAVVTTRDIHNDWVTQTLDRANAPVKGAR